MKRFYLTDGSRKVGPFSYDQILAMVSKCQIGVTDKVYDSEYNEWFPLNRLANLVKNSQRVDDSAKSRSEKRKTYVPLSSGANRDDGEYEDSADEYVAGLIDTGISRAEDPELGSQMVSQTSSQKRTAAPLKVFDKPIVPPSNEGRLKVSREKVILWQAQIRNEIAGPFSYLQILTMLSDGVLQDHSLIRKQGEVSWKKINQESDFSIENLSKLEVGAAREIVSRGGLRRSTPRKDMNVIIRASTGDSSYHVLMGDLSLGGCSLFTAEAIFNRGDVLYLSILSGFDRGDGDFNAQVEILNRVPMEYEDGVLDYKYSTRFTALTSGLLEEIKALMISEG